MSAIRIYLEDMRERGDIILTEEGWLHKLKNVLRCKPGEQVSVFNGRGAEGVYTIKGYGKGSISLKPAGRFFQKDKPAHNIILAFPALQEKKTDTILQKATELGVGGFTPFFCQRSLSPKNFKTRIKRWNSIIIEAARQSGRLWLPVIKNVSSFQEILSGDFSCKMAAVPGGNPIDFSIIKPEGDFLLLVGPEGGFSRSETEELDRHFFKVDLSPNTLRTETAAIFFVGLINYFLKTDNA